MVNVSLAVSGTEVLNDNVGGDQLQTVLGVPGGEFEAGGARSPGGRLQFKRTTPLKPFDGVTVIV